MVGVSLDTFGRLKAESAAERAAAAAGVVAALGGAEAGPKELEYALKRLVSGLPSSAGRAREGFAAALAALLEARPAVPASRVLALAREHITLAASSSRQEKREYMMGRTFCTLALARAGRFAKGGDVPPAEAAALFGELLEFAAGKKPLRELCYEAAALLVDVSPADVVRKHYVPLLSPLFSTAPAEYTPEVLALALAVRASFAGKKGAGEVPFRRVRDMLAPAALVELAEPLAESVTVHPRLHTVWERLASAVEGDAAAWRALWAGVADGVLLKYESSLKRKALGLMAFARLARAVPANDVAEHLLTKPLVAALSWSLARPQSEAHAAARAAAAALADVAERSSAAGLACVRRLVASDRNFDQRTKSRVVQSMVRRLGADEAEAYLATVAAAFAEPLAPAGSDSEGDDDDDDAADDAKKPADARKEAAKVQKWAAEQMYTIARGENATDEVRLTALRFLMYHAYFEAGAAPAAAPKKRKGRKAAAAAVYVPPAASAPVPRESRQACEARFHALLSDLLPTRGEWGAAEAHAYWAALEAAGHRTLTVRSDEAEEHRAVAAKELRKARTEDAEGRQSTMRSLLLHVGLLLLGAGEPREEEGSDEEDENGLPRLPEDEPETENDEEVAGLLRDLAQIYSEWRGGKDEERLYMDVLVDVLLALLARPSNLLRDVASRAFAEWCGDMTESALHSLVQVLSDSGAGMGGGEGAAGDEDEDADMEGDEDDEDEDEDEEESDDEEEESDDEEDSDEDDAEKASDEDDAEDADKQAALMAEFEEYDEHLVRIVRLRQQRRSQQRALAQQSVHFRLRVMDLVESFVRRHPESALVYQLYVPLLLVIRRGRDSAGGNAKADRQKLPLLERAMGLYRNRLCKTKEFPEEPKVAGDAPPRKTKARRTPKKGKKGAKAAADAGADADADAAKWEGSPSHPVLLELLEAAVKAPDALVLQLANAGAIHVARGFAGPPVTGEAELTPRQAEVAVLYESFLRAFATKRHSRLNWRFFAEFVAAQPAVAWRLAAVAAEVAAAPAGEGGAANSHRRDDLFQLLAETSRQRGDAANMPAHVARVSPLVAAAVAAAVGAGGDPKHLRPAFRAGTAVAVAHARAVDAGAAAGVFNADAVWEAVAALPEDSLARLRGPIKNFAKAAGASLEERVPSLAAKAPAKKRKAKAAGDDDEAEEEAAGEDAAEEDKPSLKRARKDAAKAATAKAEAKAAANKTKGKKRRGDDGKKQQAKKKQKK